MNNYIAFGNCDPNLIIDNTQYVFINGFCEFIGTSFFIFLLITILVNINLKNTNKFIKSNFFISFSISIALFIAYLLSIAFNYLIINNISSNKAVDIFNSDPLLFNPSFSIAYMIKGFNYQIANFYLPVGNGFIYILFEFIGALFGSFIAYFVNKKVIHNYNGDAQLIRNCFYTSSKSSKNKISFFHETINTLIFMVLILFFVLILSNLHDVGINILKQFLVCVSLFIVLFTLNSIVGNALNPFRDICPWITCYTIFKKQRQLIKKDAKYLWVVSLGPTLGCVLGTIIMPGFLYC